MPPRVSPPSATVFPDPDIVPPVHVVIPVTVSESDPVRTPLLASVSFPVVNAAPVPRLTVPVLLLPPTETDVNVYVPPVTGPVRLRAPELAVNVVPKPVSVPLRLAVPPLTCVAPVMSNGPASLTVPDPKSTVPGPVTDTDEGMVNVPLPPKTSSSETERPPEPPRDPPPSRSRVPELSCTEPVPTSLSVAWRSLVAVPPVLARVPAFTKVLLLPWVTERRPGSRTSNPPRCRTGPRGELEEAAGGAGVPIQGRRPVVVELAARERLVIAGGGRAAEGQPAVGDRLSPPRHRATGPRRHPRHRQRVRPGEDAVAGERELPGGERRPGAEVDGAGVVAAAHRNRRERVRAAGDGAGQVEGPRAGRQRRAQARERAAEVGRAAADLRRSGDVERAGAR